MLSPGGEPVPTLGQPARHSGTGSKGHGCDDPRRTGPGEKTSDWPAGSLSGGRSLQAHPGGERRKSLKSALTSQNR